MTHWIVVANVFASAGPNDQVPYSDAPLFAPDCQYTNGIFYLYANDVSALYLKATNYVAPPPTPPTLGFLKSGNVLNFSWSGAFELRSQTNNLSVGLNTNNAAWFDYPGGGSSPVNINVDASSPTVFFRLQTAP